jgi:hypothetical protein
VSKHRLSAILAAGNGRIDKTVAKTLAIAFAIKRRSGKIAA